MPSVLHRLWKTGQVRQFGRLHNDFTKPYQLRCNPYRFIPVRFVSFENADERSVIFRHFLIGKIAQTFFGSFHNSTQSCIIWSAVLWKTMWTMWITGGCGVFFGRLFGRIMLTEIYPLWCGFFSQVLLFVSVKNAETGRFLLPVSRRFL